VIIGTAGHIDHGKTALVRALTGVDTDRLPEEKRRGITIDLGFAPLSLDGVGTVGVVDVPGHEDFVRSMLVGATGIDLGLLVVAADEGVMGHQHGVDKRRMHPAKELQVARDAIVALGGYVGASTTSSQGDKPSAQITYRIPADKWEQALDVLRNLNGLTTKVDTEHTEAVEVTGQVVDLEARIATLQALHDRLNTCIGCGCLSIDKCELLNPEDEAAGLGVGAHYLLQDGRRGRG